MRSHETAETFGCKLSYLSWGIDPNEDFDRKCRLEMESAKRGLIDCCAEIDKNRVSISDPGYVVRHLDVHKSKYVYVSRSQCWNQ